MLPHPAVAELAEARPQRSRAAGRVGALIISTSTKPKTTSATPYNHYALLCSMEDVFGLSHLGFAGAPGLTCFGKDVYNAP